MMLGHGANPIFFDKKKDWTSRTLPNPPTPYVWYHLIFVLPPPPTPLHPSKWTSYVYHPLSAKLRVNQLSRPLKKWGPPIWSPFWNTVLSKIGLFLWGSGMTLEPKSNIRYSQPTAVLSVLLLRPFRISNCTSNIF